MKKKILLSVLALALVLSLSVSVLAASSDSIDVSRAQEIALEHAGVDASEAVFTKSKLDKNVYEIKFYCGTNKYEYDISYETGEVLDYEWDIKSGNQPASPTTMPARSASAAAENGQPADLVQNSVQPEESDGDSKAAQAPTRELSAGEILDIALEKAGVTDFAEVSFEKLALDDGVYKIEFRTGGVEYKYEISASTGELLNQKDNNQEIDNRNGKDNKEEAQEQNPAANGDWITGLEAEEIALSHAGIARTDTKYIHSYYRYYHGVPYAYQVEFGVYATQYCYVIDVNTGEIRNNYVYNH